MNDFYNQILFDPKLIPFLTYFRVPEFDMKLTYPLLSKKNGKFDFIELLKIEVKSTKDLLLLLDHEKCFLPIGKSIRIIEITLDWSLEKKTEGKEEDYIKAQCGFLFSSYQTLQFVKILEGNFTKYEYVRYSKEGPPVYVKKRKYK